MAIPLRVPEPEVMDDTLEAEVYERGDFRRVNAAFVRRLGRAIDGDAKGHALDLGTGPGDIPILFCKRFAEWSATAVDMSQAMLDLGEIARRQEGLTKRLRFVLGDAKTIRFRRRFDLIYSNSLLHHLPDPAPFWDRLPSFGHAGSRVVVMDLRRPNSKAEARALVKKHASGEPKLLQQLFHQSLLAAFTPKEVRAQLKEAGLDSLRVRATTDRHMVIDGQL